MIDVARMLVVVAVHTEQFPVAAIGRIEIVIVVAMMNGQFGQVCARELARATAANPRIHLERAFAITMAALFRVTTRSSDDAVEFGVVQRGFARAHAPT